MGEVVGQATWPPGSLLGSLPPVHPDHTLYSLTLRIDQAGPAFPETSSRVTPGVVEAFLASPPPAGLVGRRIEALLEQRGDTQGARWWISDIAVLH